MGHCQGLGALHAGRQEPDPGHLCFSLDTLCWVFLGPPPASPTYSQTCSLQTSAHPTSVPPSIQLPLSSDFQERRGLAIALVG